MSQMRGVDMCHFGKAVLPPTSVDVDVGVSAAGMMEAKHPSIIDDYDH